MKRKEIAKFLSLPFFCFMLAVASPSEAKAEEAETSAAVQQAEVSTSAGSSSAQHYDAAATSSGSASSGSSAGSSSSTSAQGNASGSSSGTSAQESTSGQSSGTSSQGSAAAQSSGTSSQESTSAQSSGSSAQESTSTQTTDAALQGSSDSQPADASEQNHAGSTGTDSSVQEGSDQSGVSSAEDSEEKAGEGREDREVEDADEKDGNIISGADSGKDILISDDGDTKEAISDVENGDPEEPISGAEAGDTKEQFSEAEDRNVKAADANDADVSAPAADLNASLSSASTESLNSTDSLQSGAKISPLKAAKNTGNGIVKAPARVPSNSAVASIGDTEYSTFGDAIAAALSDAAQAAQNTVVKILTDISDYSGTIMIDTGKRLTLSGNGTTNLSFSEGGIVVNGGILTLGSDTKENSDDLVITDARTPDEYGDLGSSLITVVNGGTLNLNQDVKIARQSADTFSVSIGYEADKEEEEESRTSTFHGNGGSLDGGLLIGEKGSGYIHGGSYNSTNEYVPAVEIRGKFNEITNAAITGRNDDPSNGQPSGTGILVNTDAILGRIDQSVITGGSSAVANYGTITGNISNCAISGRNGIENEGWIKGSISDCRITASQAGINNIYINNENNKDVGLINKISGCTITNGATQSEFFFYGLNNNGGTINTVEKTRISSNKGNMTGFVVGIFNASGTISRISDCEIEENNTSEEGACFGLENLGKIGKLENSTIDIQSPSFAVGIYNAGFMPVISGVISEAERSIGVSTYGFAFGLYNERGTIGTIGAYTSTDEKTGETTIRRSSFKGTDFGLVNTPHNSTAAIIERIENSTFEGQLAGAGNTDYEDDGQYTGTAIRVIGDGNVFLGTGEDSYGYANDSPNKTEIEPDLTNSGKAIGTGRYWGANGGIVDRSDVWSEYESQSPANVYPLVSNTDPADSVRYHLSYTNDADKQDSLYRKDVAEYPDQAFQYLKRSLTLSYGANVDGTGSDITVTGSVGDYTEQEDAQTITVAQNPFVLSGESIDEVAGKGDFDGKHYKFIGWNTKADGTGTWYQPGTASAGAKRRAMRRFSAGELVQAAAGASTIILSDDTTLYAQWQLDDHTLTFVYNKGKNAAGTTEDTTETDVHGENVTAPVPTRDGWRFDGWYSDQDLTNLFDFSKGLQEDTTVYAGWTPYAVHYDGNGADEGVMDPSEPEEDGSVVTVSGNAFSRDGYTFAGWNTQSDGKGETIQPESVLDPLTDDLVLYAQWTKNETPVPEKPGDNPATPEKPGDNPTTPEKPADNSVDNPTTPEKPADNPEIKPVIPEKNPERSDNDLRTEPVNSEKKQVSVIATGNTVTSKTTTENLSDTPKTGDPGAIPWIFSLIGSAAGAFGLSRKKRKK